MKAAVGAVSGRADRDVSSFWSVDMFAVLSVKRDATRHGLHVVSDKDSLGYNHTLHIACPAARYSVLCPVPLPEELSLLQVKNLVH